DLGSLDADGFLRITGRKKELIVLSSGKKIVPAHIEGLLAGDPCIDQVVVHGEGKNFLTALVVPHWPNLRTALAEAGFVESAQAQCILARHPRVHQFLERRIAVLLEEVSPWGRVKQFAILEEPFSLAREELTVSLKLRRQ